MEFVVTFPCFRNDKMTHMIEILVDTVFSVLPPRHSLANFMSFVETRGFRGSLFTVAVLRKHHVGKETSVWMILKVTSSMDFMHNLSMMTRSKMK